MSRLKLNITASLLGQTLVIVTQLITLPLYLHILGVESYGLIGFYITLQATIQAFDFGLGSTINREMAKYNSGVIDCQKAISTVATIEVIFLFLISILAIIACIAIPFYYLDVITTKTIMPNELESTLYLMCALIGLLWLGNLYQNGLMGLEKHVSFNIIKSISVIANPIITLSALFIFDPKIQVFFLAQIFFSLFFICYIRFSFFKKLHIPKNIRPIYSWSSLAGLKKYMLGTGIISIAGVFFSVSDRWILINIVSLEDFARYTLALTMSNGLYLFITPVFMAIFPRFTALINSHQLAQLKSLYTIFSKSLTVFILAIAIHLSLYSEQIFFWWLRDREIASEVYPVAQILVLGTAFNGMMALPFAIQLSYGWVKLGLGITLGLLAAFIPVALYLANHFGTMGCAIAWTSLNLIYFLLGSIIISKKLKKTAGFTIPLLFNITTFIVIACIAVTIKTIFPNSSDFLLGASLIVFSFITCVYVILLLNRDLRGYSVYFIRMLFAKCSKRLKNI